MKYLILLSILLTGCGGGGGSSTPESYVNVLIVDDGFTQDADVQYVMYADPMVAGTFTGDHGDASITEFRNISNAHIAGYVPWDDTVIPNPDWPYAFFFDQSPNTTLDKVDLNKAIRFAADNGFQVVYVRWAGCCFDDTYEEAAKYAWDRGTVVIFPAAQGNVDLPYESPYMFVVSSLYPTSNTGAAVDWTSDTTRYATSHPAVKSAAMMANIYRDYNPTPDAEGSQFVINTFLSGRIQE
jgi:hypothetical protein